MIKHILFSTLIAGAIASQAPAQVTSLAVHYKLDETSGSVAIDSSVNALDGTYMTGYTLGQAGAHPGTLNAVDFDETLFGHAMINDSLPLTNMTSDLSIAAWIYPETDGVHNGVMRIFGNNNAAWSCARNASGLTFTTRWIKDYIIPATVPLQQWTHVAFVFDSNFDVTFYVDGLPVGTVTGSSASSNPNAEWFIGGFDGIVEFWDGLLDDIQVYEGTLTAADVAFLFAHPGTTIGGTGPIGTPYCFGDGSGTTCPCANNNNGGGGGCDWGDPAFPEGGILEATGSVSMSANDAFLLASGISNNFGIFFGADNQVNGGNGNPLNDGLRCAGGGLVRLIPPTMASGNQATTPFSVQTLDSGAASGATRRYQYWFRTPTGPCGQQANLTNGLEIAWLP